MTGEGQGCTLGLMEAQAVSNEWQVGLNGGGGMNPLA